MQEVIKPSVSLKTKIMENTTTVNTLPELPVQLQLQLAFRKGNRLATCIGFTLGIVVPFMSFAVLHEIPKLSYTELSFWILCVMAIGGCFFSLKSVIVWGQRAFRDKPKAIAFALLLEGMLIVSGILPSMFWLGYAALAYLAFINAISCGCNIAMDARNSTMAPAQRKRLMRKKK